MRYGVEEGESGVGPVKDVDGVFEPAGAGTVRNGVCLEAGKEHAEGEVEG